MRPRLSMAQAATLALLAAGCGRCGRPPEAAPERWLPREVRGALLLPRLGDAATQAAGLLRTALTIPAAQGLAEPLAALKVQLGFDPLDPAGLSEAGLDPARGAAAAALADGTLLAVLPVADPARLDAVVARLARDRLGAAVREESREPTAVVTTFRRAAGQPPALCYALAGGTALLSAGAAGPAAVAAALARREPEALPALPAFASARAALGPDPAALLFSPASAALAAQVPALRDGGALGVKASGAGLWLRLVVLLPAERLEVWREVAGGDDAAAAGRDELARLPGDLFAAGRFGGSPEGLLRRLGYALPPDLSARLARARLDLSRDLGSRLAPGAAAGLSLSPSFQMGALAGGVGAAARDPFRLVHLSAVLRVRDAAGLRAELGRLEKAGPALGLRIAARAIPGGGTAWSTPVGGGTLAWALEGERLLVAGGAGRLEALLQPGAGFQAPTPGVKEALASGGAAAAVDFPGLVRRLRALPEDAFGTGPDGFVMRALADRFLEPASHLASAWLRLEVLPDAARVDLALEALAP